MKGLLYGYYIGVLLSTSSEITERANILNEVNNIFSSILYSENHVPTDLQNKRLMYLFQELQNRSSVALYLQSKLRNPEEINEVINYLKQDGCTFPNSIDSKLLIDSFENTKVEDVTALKWLENENKSLIDRKIKEQIKLLPSDEEIIVVDNKLDKINYSLITDTTERLLMKAWVNEVLNSPDYNEKVSVFAESLSDVVTRKAKEVYGKTWDESNAKKELNQMRRYVRGQESIINWKDGLFSSITAVICKGSDWEQLQNFMQSKSLSDYRMAFAFYGELNGFANLTRLFTDILFNLDETYVEDVYKELFGQLHGEDPKHGSSSINISSTNEENAENQEIITDKKHLGNVIEEGHNTRQKKQDILNYANIVLKRNSKKEIYKESLQQALDDSREITDMKSFFSKLRQYEGWTKKDGKPCKAWVDMYKHFVNEEGLLLFDVNEGRMHVTIPFDYNHIKEIIKLISDNLSYSDKVISYLAKDLEWVLNSTYIGNKTTQELIMDFKHQIEEGKMKPKSANGKDLTWKNKLYQEIDINSIISLVKDNCE